MKTVLASVSDKTGLVEFLKVLETFDSLRIIATGSTAQFLQKSGISCETVESLTGFPEILEGRVKTLHPRIFGGILAKDTLVHQSHLQAHQIPSFDYVIVNLYPFESIAKAGSAEEEVIENIDIGGSALIRAAAKNYQNVVVIPGREFYAAIINELSEKSGTLSDEFRKTLARKAFEKTSYYDSVVSAWLFRSESDELPNELTIHLTKIQDLRYGENPQQPASLYQQNDTIGKLPFNQVQGKEMSANNIADAYAAFKLLREFPADPACCIIKHNNPCGVAIGKTIEEAFDKAYDADPLSAFGGVFGINRTLSGEIADKIANRFVEVVIAPYFSPEALVILSQKKNLRLIQAQEIMQPADNKPSWMLRDFGKFGIVLQEESLPTGLPELSTVTRQALNPNILSDVSFAWSVVKHLTSNAVVIAKNGQTAGLGIGQTSRIGSMNIAMDQAGDKANGAVLASDGFFPATDNIEAAASAGISVIIQPGGSIKDPEVIEAADQRGLVMVMTHERCFKH